MVEWNIKLKEEFEGQKESPEQDGVPVKLFHKDMNDMEDESEFHIIPYHRVWMDGEYIVLSDVEVEQLKEEWINKYGAARDITDMIWEQ